jgi:hypothetical protein
MTHTLKIKQKAMTAKKVKPKGKSETPYRIITIRLTEELHGRIEASSIQSNISTNHLVNELIRSGLDIIQTRKDTMKLPKFLKMLRVMSGENRKK